MANADIKVIIKKTLPYQGGTRTFSNDYHANGGVPADNSHWDALFDAIVAAEKLIYQSGITITEAVGYTGAGTIATHSKAYTTAGTASLTGANPPGDVAALLRFATAARTSKGHPIYLFNYFHGAVIQSGADFELLSTAQKTLIETYGTAWLTGFSDGTNTYVRAGPRGANATARTVHQFVTHRDFPR
jgi:hypothetical protein